MSFDLSLSAAEAFLPEAPPSNPAFYGSTHARSRDSVRWTPTNHILSTTAHNEIRLLGPSGDIGELKDVSEIRSSEPIYACEPCPILTEYENAVFLYSAREHHIQLRNAYDPEMGLVASYRYTNPTTEAFMSPRSLCFTPDGFHFLAGAKNEIALFDLKDQFNPVSTYVTGGRNRSMHMGGLPTGVRGLVTAIACQEQTFAIGTFERHVGLYDMRSMGPIVNFTLDVPSRQETNGRGVSQIKWSPCGNFLYLAERCSDGICVMDVRSGGQLISWLAGRRAGTMMRLEFDVVPTSDGHEVWAGGVDGKLRVWSNPHRGTGSQTFSSTCQMFEDNVPVSSVAFDNGETLMAVTRGVDPFNTFAQDSDKDSSSDAGYPAASTEPTFTRRTGPPGDELLENLTAGFGSLNLPSGGALCRPNSRVNVCEVQRQL